MDEYHLSSGILCILPQTLVFDLYQQHQWFECLDWFHLPGPLLFEIKSCQFFITSKWDTHIGLNSFHTHKNTNYSTQIKFNSTKILTNLQKLQGDPFYPIKIQNISMPNSLLKIYSETNFAILSLQYHYSSLQIQLSKSLSGHWKNDACLA